MLDEHQRLPEELVMAIIEEAWHSPMSVPERIHSMTSFPLVSTLWFRVYTLISFRDIHVPSLRFLEHYKELVLKANQDRDWAYKRYGYLPSGICKSIVVEPQAESGLVFDAVARMVKHDHDCLHTLVHVNDEFHAGDIFDTWTYRNVPPQITFLELRFMGRANMQSNKNLSTLLSRGRHNVAWAIPNLRCLTIIGGDEEFLRHFLPAIVYRDLAMLVTDFPVKLHDIDFRFGNHKIYTLPPNLKHRQL
ncbi:hypothetical protein JR316_0008155 [Psilocybe cubensis]|uniref:Uncharacterized protein n=2 Tax=Psilocybe cubensis TaxID=181762 RepID=A0ACB8GUZ3_PSICU|nr:hypothetical protein JR316_0008155 [Psilocybe cubensis]KAH9479560.1 hypothetical protein JR316_0008155 [Psilocybe cubensis]